MPFSVEMNVPAYLGSSIAKRPSPFLPPTSFRRCMCLHEIQHFLSPPRNDSASSGRGPAGRPRSHRHTSLAAFALSPPRGDDSSLPTAHRFGSKTCWSLRREPQDWNPSLPIDCSFVSALMTHFFSSEILLHTHIAKNPHRREAYELFLRGHHEWQTLQRHRMQDGIQHLTAGHRTRSVPLCFADRSRQCVRHSNDSLALYRQPRPRRQVRQRR